MHIERRKITFFEICLDVISYDTPYLQVCTEKKSVWKYFFLEKSSVQPLLVGTTAAPSFFFDRLRITAPSAAICCFRGERVLGDPFICVLLASPNAGMTNSPSWTALLSLRSVRFLRPPPSTFFSWSPSSMRSWFCSECDTVGGGGTGWDVFSLPVESTAANGGTFCSGPFRCCGAVGGPIIRSAMSINQPNKANIVMWFWWKLCFCGDFMIFCM